MMDSKSIGDKIAQLRQLSGLTQEELAVKCNVTARTIQRIEANQVSPRAYTLRTLSETLGEDLIALKPGEKHHSIWHLLFWNVRQLFNFKTNRMKKISILTTTTIALLFAFFLISGSSPEKENNAFMQKPKSGVSASFNSNNELELLEVVFDKNQSLDSLIKMRSYLKTLDVELNLLSLKFDDKENLIGIACSVSDGESSGSTDIPDISATTFGFYFNYSKATANRMSFCLGNCWDIESRKTNTD